MEDLKKLLTSILKALTQVVKMKLSGKFDKLGSSSHESGTPNEDPFMRNTAGDASMHLPLLCLYNQAYGHVTRTIAGQQDQKSGGRNLTWSQRKETQVGTCQALLCLFVTIFDPKFFRK